MAKKLKPSEVSYKAGITERFNIARKYILGFGLQGIELEKDFAESIGEYAQNLSKYEKGLRTPTLDNIGRLCSIYGISLRWVFFGEGDMFEKGEDPLGMQDRIDSMTKAIKSLTRKLG